MSIVGGQGQRPDVKLPICKVHRKYRYTKAKKSLNRNAFGIMRGHECHERHITHVPTVPHRMAAQRPSGLNYSLSIHSGG